MGEGLLYDTGNSFSLLLAFILTSLKTFISVPQTNKKHTHENTKNVIDWLIDCLTSSDTYWLIDCLTSSDMYFSYIHDENKSINNTWCRLKVGIELDWCLDCYRKAKNSIQ